MEPEISNSDLLSQPAHPDGTNTELTSPVQLNQTELQPIIRLEEEPHRYECGSCGYIYEPASGDPRHGVAIGTLFTDLPKEWRCPVCTARSAAFADIGIPSKPSGFTENLGYGFGVNVMTPGQKNILIFGALAAAFAVFMSLYALD